MEDPGTVPREIQIWCTDWQLEIKVKDSEDLQVRVFFPQSSKKFHFNVVHHKGASVFREMVGGYAQFWSLRAEVPMHIQHTQPKGTTTVKFKTCLWTQLTGLSQGLGRRDSNEWMSAYRTGGCPEHSMVTATAAETSSVYSECDSGHLASSLLFSVVRIPRNISP